MANPDLLDKLCQRMSAEQEQYRNWLLDQPPGVILDHAAEYDLYNIFIGATVRCLH